MRYRVALWLALGGCATPSSEVVVSDYIFLGREPLESRFVLKDGMYVCGDVRVPAEFVLYLRRLAEEAPTRIDTPPPELGITLEAVEYHWNDMLEVALLGYEEIVPMEVPEEFVHLFSYEHVRDAALYEFALAADDTITEDPGLSITLPGDPPMDLVTLGVTPWRQPWLVRLGDKERKVYSIEISKAVAVFADPRGHGAQGLNGARYWGHGFWRDYGVWNQRIGSKLVARHALTLCSALPGHERLTGRFRIELGDVAGAVDRRALAVGEVDALVHVRAGILSETWTGETASPSIRPCSWASR